MDKFKFVWGESDSMFILEAAIKLHMIRQKIIATESHNMVITCRRRMAGAYYPEQDLDSAKIVGKDFLKETVRRKYFKGCMKAENDFMALLRRFRLIRVAELSNRQLSELLKKFSRNLTLILAYYQLTTAPEYLEEMEKRLKSLLNKEEEFFTLVRIPVLTDVEEQEIDLISMVLKKQYKDKDIYSYLNRYPQLAYNTYDDSVIADFLKEKISDLGKLPKSKLLQKRNKILNDKKLVLGGQKRILNKYKGDLRYEISVLSGAVRDLGILRFRLKRYWAGAEYWFKELFREIAKRMDIDLITLMWVYNTEDVKDFLVKGKRSLKAQIEKRKESYTYVLRDGRLKLLTGVEEAAFLKKYFKKELSGSNELKGNVANKGYAKGKVKIIHVNDIEQFSREAKDFDDGDIMVCTMTQINAVPLMKKAGAILTEQGGITCHAAIISRELNKPCIVGINNLSNTLKNGDLVEVNARTGTIKKI